MTLMLSETSSNKSSRDQQTSSHDKSRSAGTGYSVVFLDTEGKFNSRRSSHFRLMFLFKKEFGRTGRLVVLLFIYTLTTFLCRLSLSGCVRSSNPSGQNQVGSGLGTRAWKKS